MNDCCRQAARTIATMIEHVIGYHGAPDNPRKPDELWHFVQAYFPERHAKAETVRRTAQKLREEKQNNSWTDYSVENLVSSS